LFTRHPISSGSPFRIASANFAAVAAKLTITRIADDN
jgi:hypothetical protein